MVETSIQADSVGTAILELILAAGTWEGTATQLLAALDERRNGTPPRGWPETPQAMGGRLTRAAPLLRASGIEVERDRGTGSNRTRLIRLAQIGNGSSESSGCLRDRPAGNPRAGTGPDISDMPDKESGTRAKPAPGQLNLDADRERALDEGVA